ncbi:beta-N-acetylhexosaminidase [Alkaliflexus imshenetskii]|uniref:beta-N-acetylhexosaminidase n=1 Tax=Alkaliflexus imshenetskii TaxID=286730 RepID=UPI0004BBBD84|nr:beta-N-acetylhexosaminidase [Alkaliflexus imshenetskii]
MRMNMSIFKVKVQVYAILMLAIVSACDYSNRTFLTEAALIPVPVSVSSSKGFFEFSEKTNIYLVNADLELHRVAEFLNDYISPSTGFLLSVKEVESAEDVFGVIFVLSDDSDFRNEEYELRIMPNKVVLTSATHEGIFRGIQTIRQLLPASIEKQTVQNDKWVIPAGVIRDYPRFQYRGAMLDVSRHFFGVEDVKRYIDYLASIKMNRFHMHLTDDQGWRIEIKSWPKLTEIGGQTQVGGGRGGFYTQDEFSEIVRYADDRFIVVVPEIDMPGHTNAALASYPELNPDGIAPELYTGIDVGFSTLDTRNELTYTFVEDVIREIAQLTTGDYLHIGGDESWVTAKEDYIYFINRVQDIVLKYNKRIVGWDEIATAELRPGAISQFWKHEENALKAAQQGGSIIVSPADRAYLDMKYDSTTVIGLSWSGFIEVDRAYEWEPTALVEGFPEALVYGVEAPLWTETIETMKDIEYMIFPRILGIAEIAWSSADNRSWDEYKFRLAAFEKRLSAKDVNFYKSPLVPRK